MRTIVVGVCAVGSGVGQSVVASCNLSRLPITTVGLGTNPMAFGLYECDEYELTPSFYDAGYIDSLIETCQRRGIELLIPGHDDEAELIARHLDVLHEHGIDAVVAGPDLVRMCRNKEAMAATLNEVVPAFVRSYTRHDLAVALENGEVDFPMIAKPRGGFASRGVTIVSSPRDLDGISDAFIFQEIAVPHAADPEREAYLSRLEQKTNSQIAEVSIQLVAHKDGSLMGRMATYNKLQNGVPMEILPYDDASMWETIDRLYPHLVGYGLRGPLNLQGRMTDNGLRLFEMNPRFTGITGLRARLGFNEVEACIQEWATGQPARMLSFNPSRFGTRQMTDKALSFSRSETVRAAHARILATDPPSEPVRLLITGSTGQIGQRLVRALSGDAGFEILAMDRDKLRAVELHGDSSVRCYDWQDLEDGALSLGCVDRLCHLASARPHHGPHEIAVSYRRTAELFQRAVDHCVFDIIHVSSQSVYGHLKEPPWSESDVPAPETTYATTKLAAEVLLEVLAREHPELRHTSLRLATVTGPGSAIAEHEAVAKIAHRIARGDRVEIRGGAQLLERIDIRDAVSAIACAIRSDSFRWKPVMNVAPKCAVALREIAETAVLLARDVVGAGVGDIRCVEGSREKSFGMDGRQFCETLNWRPSYDIRDSLWSILDRFFRDQQVPRSDSEVPHPGRRVDGGREVHV